MQPLRAAFVATCAAVAAANSLELELPNTALEDVPAGPRELHQRYSEIFRYGNRNAASHLWTSYILDRASVTPAAQIELLFSGFCAVSGSPVYPSDYKRYRLTLPHVAINHVVVVTGNVTMAPTPLPTGPSYHPTYAPTYHPTHYPTYHPSARPSPLPTTAPSRLPLPLPTPHPTFDPTVSWVPSASPSPLPTAP